MISLRKTRNNKNSPRKKSGTKKRVSQKKSQQLAKLKEEIKLSILNELKQTGLQQNIPLENKNKPKSGHVLAGQTWDQSEAGKQWKAEIDIAQKELDTLMQQMGYNMAASGKFARELASKKRKNPDQAGNLAKNIAEKIIKSKEKQLEQQAFKQPKPISPVKIVPQTLNESSNITMENEIIPLNQQQPIIGGFFDDSSDED